MVSIHQTAFVDKNAELSEDVSIGAYSIIGPEVRIGPRCVIGSHVVIEKDTEIGSDNKFGPFCTIGMDPQSIKYKGEKTTLHIGNNNTFREYVNIDRGSPEGHLKTVIGDENFIMSYSHIAHDCIVGNKTVFANVATLAGHVEIGDWTIIGGLAAIHQFVRIGSHVMLAGNSAVVQDIPPFVIAQGDRCVPQGINTIGLSRRGFSQEAISAIKDAYRIIYNQKLKLRDAIQKIETELLPGCSELKVFVDFLKSSERGIAR